MRYQVRVIAVFVFMIAVACSTKGPDAGQLPVTTPPVTCISIGPVITPGVATLHPGDTLRARTDSTMCASGVVHFRWLSSDTAIGTVDSASGLIRARSKGVASIIAEMLEDPTVKRAMVLQVVP